MGKVICIGLGPGDPELMTLKGSRLIGACPVLAYPAPDDGDIQNTTVCCRLSTTIGLTV